MSMVHVWREGCMANRSMIDPEADMVIARFASYPVAGNDPTTGFY